MDDANIEFCAEYHHDGATWGLNIFAKDIADAVAKIESMRVSLKLLGELAMKATIQEPDASRVVVDSREIH